MILGHFVQEKFHSTLRFAARSCHDFRTHH